MQRIIKLKAGKVKIPVTFDYHDKYAYLKFPFNRGLLDEVKTAMEGAHWCGFDTPPRKVWRIDAASRRNDFRVAFLSGANPYKIYDEKYPLITPRRKSMYNHQVEMTSHILHVHYGFWACEMGTGKTLAAIEAMEHAQLRSHEVWYVGPRAGVKAVGRELIKWNCAIRPRMLTYQGLTKVIRTWTPGQPAPKMVIFDESSKIKTPTAQMSKAAKHLADSVWMEHGMDGYVLEMSGTPSPKTPVDWWHQCEVVCPGFLRESTPDKLKYRLCLIDQRESMSGGTYPHLVTWFDDGNKCAKCGEPKDSFKHDIRIDEHDEVHDFVPSKNEVELLHKRMKGLVIVKFKKDCLELPEIQYEVRQVKPTISLLRSAKLITKTTRRAVQTLNLLRELSDGFQYKEVANGTQQCPTCAGLGKYTAKIQADYQDIDFDDPERSLINSLPNNKIREDDFISEKIECDYCGGSGTVPTYGRITETVASPKDDELIDLLDDHSECGRLIVWGGFTATIDRIVTICLDEGWTVLRVDGRGYHCFGGDATSDELLSAMDASDPKRSSLSERFPKVCFVGHPKAGGMALTLTASPTELFYSNSFDGEARMQAIARFHRAGMDTNRGARVIDLICLPTDLLVLNNLDNKKRLQDLTMGEILEVMEKESEDII